MTPSPQTWMRKEIRGFPPEQIRQIEKSLPKLQKKPEAKEPETKD